MADKCCYLLYQTTDIVTTFEKAANANLCSFEQSQRGRIHKKCSLLWQQTYLWDKPHSPYIRSQRQTCLDYKANTMTVQVGSGIGQRCNHCRSSPP